MGVERFYGLNCSPRPHDPNVYAEDLTSNVIVFGDRAIGR